MEQQQKHQVKKKNTGENALRKLFPNCGSATFHKTQAIGLLSPTTGELLMRFKRSVLEWSSISADLSPLFPQGIAGSNIGCCAADRVLNRTDPSEAFIVKLCKTFSPSSTSMNSNKRRNSRSFWCVIAFRRSDGSVVSSESEIAQQRVKDICSAASTSETSSTTNTSTTTTITTIIPQQTQIQTHPITKSIITTTQTQFQPQRLVEEWLPQATIYSQQPENYSPISPVSPISPQSSLEDLGGHLKRMNMSTGISEPNVQNSLFVPKNVHQKHQLEAERVWSNAFGMDCMKIDWDDFTAWLRARCIEATDYQQFLLKLKDILCLSSTTTSTTSTNTTRNVSNVLKDRWVMLSLVFRNTSVNNDNEDPREVFNVKEIAELCCCCFHGFVERAAVEVILNGRTEPHCGFFRMSESSRGFLVLTRRLPTEAAIAASRPSIVHTLVGKHVSGELTLALQDRNDSERTTFDVPVGSIGAKIESTFWYEVASPANGFYSTLQQLVSEKSIQEGLPPCKLFPMRTGYEDPLSSSKK